jgi:hypothetical protein
MKPAVLAWAMAATLALVAAEVLGGLLGRSVALLNDAVHNLSDVPALGISWLAMRWAQRPADTEKTGIIARGRLRRLRMRFCWWCWRFGWATRQSNGCALRWRW